jgi:hypothetical protein
MPIYCNDNTLLCVGDDMAEEYKDYIKKEGLKKMKEDSNREDISKEEYYLYDIISACENILDDMENGARIEQSDFNNLGYVDGIMLRMQHNVNRQLNPTNIKDD